MSAAEEEDYDYWHDAEKIVPGDADGHATETEEDVDKANTDVCGAATAGTVVDDDTDTDDGNDATAIVCDADNNGTDDDENTCSIDETLMESVTSGNNNPQKRSSTNLVSDQPMKKHRTRRLDVELYDPVTLEATEYFPSIRKASLKTGVGKCLVVHRCLFVHTHTL